MKLLKRLLDRLPLVPLLFLAVLLGLAPFSPQPHLTEKIAMLAQGELVRPIDILDLIWHGLPMVLLALKLAFKVVERQTSS